MSGADTGWIGRSVPRREDPRLLAGEGVFVADVVLPDMVHAAIARSQLAHANIVSIELDAARALPGVATALSGWTARVHHHGRAIVLAAAAYGGFIALAGLMPSFWLVALALALAFLASGIAEIHFGLAMIIGAYSLGLALSSTELKHRIEEPMRNTAHFVVPVFFVVIGMQVDFGAMFDSSDGSQLTVISFAIVLTVFAIISKIVGAGLPALGVGFNALGAWRVAIGMLPRGEVALIIAGIGLASGVIGQQIFGVGILMTVVTTVLAPIMLVPAFRRKESDLREPPQAEVASSEDESG